jgi:hypothetical protein
MSEPRTTEEAAVDRVVMAAREFIRAWRLPSTPAADQIDALESALTALDQRLTKEPDPTYMDNPPAVGATKGWKYGYLPCGCHNDGKGNHAR